MGGAVTVKDIRNIVVYYADLLTDVALVVQYLDTGNIWWARFTLFFIFAPNLYGFLSTLYNRLKFHHRNGAPTLVLLFLDLTFLRMLYDLYHDHAGGTKRMRNLEASFESLPQLFLQVYIIMLGEATPTEFQFLSIVVSIANIGVSYYSLQSDFLRDATEKKIKAPKMFAGFYVFGVFARVGALASYAAAYKFSVFNWLAALWAIELFFSWAWYDKTVLAILSSLVNVLRGRSDPKYFRTIPRIFYQWIYRTATDVILVYLAYDHEHYDGEAYQPYILPIVVGCTVLRLICYYFGFKSLVKRLLDYHSGKYDQVKADDFNVNDEEAAPAK